jgi:MEMO1 family protein
MHRHDRPRLRPYVVPAQDYGDPHHIYLVDQLGLAPGPRRLTVQEFHWVRLFDGDRTLQDIHVEAVRQNGGQLLPLHRVSALARELDEHLLLDGDRYQGIVGANVRPPRCIGVYEGEPAKLRRQIDRLFTDPRGPGRPSAPRPDGSLRAVLVPHIDYPRGGHTYAWGFRELFERSEA